MVSVAQQVEQKETMAIQYTIELRKMLNDVPVREEIREFLFKVWAEVLAWPRSRTGRSTRDAGAEEGGHRPGLVGQRQAARDDRAEVIQDLPPLLKRLRATA